MLIQKDKNYDYKEYQKLKEKQENIPGVDSLDVGVMSSVSVIAVFVVNVMALAESDINSVSVCLTN